MREPLNSVVARMLVICAFSSVTSELRLVRSLLLYVPLAD